MTCALRSLYALSIEGKTKVENRALHLISRRYRFAFDKYSLSRFGIQKYTGQTHRAIGARYDGAQSDVSDGMSPGQRIAYNARALCPVTSPRSWQLLM